MKKTAKNLLIILSALILGLLIIFWKFNYNPFINHSQWQLEKTVVANTQDTNQNPDIIQLPDGCFRLYSHGAPQGDGLMNIYSYRSCDGLNWEFEGKRIDQASMPAALLTSDNKIRLYFQRGIKDNSKQALMTAISDDGLNFKINNTPLLVTEEGELKDIKTIAHFELIKLDQGYRLYFDESGLTPTDFERYKKEQWSWPVSRIRSAYSEDGLKWKLDPGVRIDYEQEPLTYMQRAGSCTVIKRGDAYHMYFNAGFSPWEDLKRWKRWSWSGIYQAVSSDGLNWQIIDKNILGHGSDPKAIKIGDKIRIYISEGDRVGGNSIGSYLEK